MIGSRERVRIRAIEREDLETLARWANDPEIWQFLGGWHFPVSRESVARWFERLDQETHARRFAVEVQGLGLVGTTNLAEIDWKNGHAEHGLMLGEPAFRGKGFGADIVRIMTRYAFEDLRFHRLDAYIIAYNEPSLRLYTKCGWREEGRQRGWYFRQERYWDRVLMGITRDDAPAALVGALPIEGPEGSLG